MSLKAQPFSTGAKHVSFEATHLREMMASSDQDGLASLIGTLRTLTSQDSQLRIADCGQSFRGGQAKGLPFEDAFQLIIPDMPD